MSVGSKSLVHCIRPKLSPRAFAIAMARVVFPSPGRSSIRRCPLEKNVSSEKLQCVCLSVKITREEIYYPFNRLAPLFHRTAP